jgi:hypothetical protein
MSRASGLERLHQTPNRHELTVLLRRYYLEKVRCLSAHCCASAYRDREHRDTGDCCILGEPCERSGDLCSAGSDRSALAAFAVCRYRLENWPRDHEAVTLTQIAPTFWGSYGASLVALLGFLVNGILTYGAAQKLAGQREEQRIADQEWKKEHSAQANLRDVAIAALQAMGNSNEATVKGVQGQLLLIQAELQALRNRAGDLPKSK